MSKSNDLYKRNKEAKCGTLIKCPICGKEFVKKQWQQAFCCSEHKDKFWNRKGDRHKDGNYYTKYNMKHPERYDYLIGKGFTRDEKDYWEAVHAFATDEEFRKYVEDSECNFDGSWDSHDVRSDIVSLYKEFENENIGAC